MICEYIIKHTNTKCIKIATVEGKWCSAHAGYAKKALNAKKNNIPSQIEAKMSAKAEAKKDISIAPITVVKNVQPQPEVNVHGGDGYRTLSHNGKIYYHGEDLMKNDSLFFRGCRNVRGIITKKKIPVEDYIYCNLVDGKVIVRDETYVRATILVAKRWCLENYPKLMPSGGDEEKYSPSEILIKDTPLAPKEIILEDDEKFKRVDGTPIDIYCVGERDYEKIYFLAKDMVREFNMENLIHIIKDANTSYVEGEHYVYFKCGEGRTFPIPTDGATDKSNIFRDGNVRFTRELFLTYDGFIRMMNVSYKKSDILKQYYRWAMRTLFTCQFGTKEAKEDVASSLLGISVKALRSVTGKSTTAIPCIYLFSLGKVKDLTSCNLDKNIPGEKIIMKYGRTEDLDRRSREHATIYEKLDKNMNLCLRLFSLIDSSNIVAAEDELRQYFKDSGETIAIDNHNELICISEKRLRDIELLYRTLGNKYGGGVKELTKNLEMRIETIRHELECATLQKETCMAREASLRNELKMKDEVVAKTMALSTVKEESMKKELEYVKTIAEKEKSSMQQEIEIMKLRQEIMMEKSKNKEIIKEGNISRFA